MTDRHAVALIGTVLVEQPELVPILRAAVEQAEQIIAAQAIADGWDPA